MKNQILTVHKSQGKEWDAVFFSVSDNTTNYFLTNSKCRTAKSLQLINTAISRARRELILVCDCNFWANREGQLISALLKISEPYDGAFGAP
jgi:ATP-dependent exoDNAse (exonuclease V) alpha subunit